MVPPGYTDPVFDFDGYASRGARVIRMAPRYFSSRLSGKSFAARLEVHGAAHCAAYRKEYLNSSSSLERDVDPFPRGERICTSPRR